METGAETQFAFTRLPREVYEAERSALELHGERVESDAPVVGLALSGGGIRSATFALGVIEALRRLDVLTRLDYLSTVGGGGHIGAWLTANCFRHRDWLQPDEANGRRWHESIARLRRYSSSLSPSLGLFSADGWSVATAWLRNTSLTLITVALATAMLLILPRVLFNIFVYVPAWSWRHVVTTGLLAFGTAGILDKLMRLNRIGRGGSRQNWPMNGAIGGVLWGSGFAFTRWLTSDPFTNLSGFAPVTMLIVVVFVAGSFFLLRLGRSVAGALAGNGRSIDVTRDRIKGVVIIPLMFATLLIVAELWAGVTQDRTPLTYGGALADLVHRR